jgi:gliding motility-associated-like protein
MRRLILLLLIFSGLSFPAFATHQRAGEITYRYISGLTYEITIISYSYAPSPADRNELPIDWGDGTSSILVRINGESGVNPAGIYCDHLGEIVGPDIKKNLYTGQHTFPGPATYTISLEDPNRNYGIQNIPSSVDIPLYIETLLTINPFIGPDNSPQLLLPPIDRGCIDHPFIHNPGAYDPDGDSLSYKLTTCKGIGGEPIPGYILPNLVDPNSTGTFSMNAVTGDITWDSPTLQGEYNIAFMIEEWRNGIKIGLITRDMQITIVSCQNQAPEISPIADTCVTAGDTLQFKVFATDPDNDKIELTATGSPFLISTSPAEFAILLDTTGETIGHFFWKTDCLHIKRNAYQVFFKAVDQSTEVNLFDVKNMYIRVVGPKTENLSVNPLGNNINLNWSPNRCSNAVSYKVYRRNGFYGFVPGVCETGVPAYTGYQLISEVLAPDTLYIDGTQSPGLAHGVDYCYMVVAVFPDGSEGYASDEVCTQLIKDVPVITNVSILSTSEESGSVYIAWSKPTEIDPLQAPGPYKYLIYRSFNFNGDAMILIDSLSSLNDTIYTDDPLNTADSPVCYRVDVLNNTPGNRFVIGPSQVASSVYITFQPGDNKLRINFNFNVPWANYLYTIYRKNEQTQLFDSIASTSNIFFIDSLLINGHTYCYKVKAIGSYSTSGITDPLINFSQEACAVPYDNEPPCPPILTVYPDCDNASNRLAWINPDPSCAEDINGYYIYYKPPNGQSFSLLDSVQGVYDTTYTHKNLLTLAGCYGIKAVDSLWNFSVMSDSVCIDSDTCGGYRLPNLFTPNGDTRNDYLVPFPFTSVEKIDLKIFNRWGTLVFESTDPQIKWDGKISGTDQPAADGVYYYVCDVYEITLQGTIKRTLKGSITVLR